MNRAQASRMARHIASVRLARLGRAVSLVCAAAWLLIDWRGTAAWGLLAAACHAIEPEPDAELNRRAGRKD